MPKTMFASTLPEFPTEVMGDWVKSFLRGRAPVIADEHREEMEPWLCYVAVDWLALKQHVAFLAQRIPTPKIFGKPLTREVLATLLEYGPEGITDPAVLAQLVLNANQLIQLHEAVYGDDQLPDSDDVNDLIPSAFWMDVIERVAALSAMAKPSDVIVNDPRAIRSVESARAVESVQKLLSMSGPMVTKPGTSARVLGLGLDARGDALKTQILAHCYGNAEDIDELTQPFGLALHAQAVEKQTASDEDKIRLHLTVTPAPRLAPLELTITFLQLPGTPEVKYLIPAYADNRREVSSLPSEPLPRAAFEFSEGRWEDKLPLRLSVCGGS